MAMIGLKVPSETARLFFELGIEGEPEVNPHVTILDLGDDCPIHYLADVIEAVYQVTSRTDPLIRPT